MPALTRFAAVADLWCGSVMAEFGQTVSGENYRHLVHALGSRKRFDAVVGEPWAERCRQELAASGTHCFHWELAFPQIFLGQSEDGAGFDVIIGNPPYDVLSEKE